MADNVIEQAQQVQPDVAQQADLKVALDQMMAISLGGGAQVQEPDAVNGGGQEAVTPTQPVVAEAVAADPFSFIKDTYGYDTPEAARRAIDELRAFKEKPQLPEFVFDNEESANILKALAAGKRAELREYLNREAQIEQLVTGDVTKENAAQIVKLKMQLTHTDLSPQEIDYRYKKQFGVPPQPVRGVDEDEDDYNGRVSQWKEISDDREMELMIEAKISRPEIAKAKGQLSVPQIETDLPVDEDYIQYKQMLEKRTQDNAVVEQAYKALVPKAVETKLNFKDETNKIEFQYQFEPDATKFAKAVEMACDQQQFWDLFKKPDGSPDRERFLDMICFAIDKENYLLSAMNQAKNATIKASLPDNSQNGLLTRQTTQSQEPNELDRLMRQSLRGHGGY